MPAPQDPSRPLPVCAGKLETDTDEGRGKRQSCAASQAQLLHDVNKEAHKLITFLCRRVHCVGCGIKPCRAARKYERQNRGVYTGLELCPAAVWDDVISAVYCRQLWPKK